MKKPFGLPIVVIFLTALVGFVLHTGVQAFSSATFVISAALKKTAAKPATSKPVQTPTTTPPVVSSKQNWSSPGAAYIKLSDYYLLPGQPVRVKGYNFKSGDVVTISILGQTATATADPSGNFVTANFTIPFNYQNSTTGISASSGSGYSGSASLTVGTFYPFVSPSSYFINPGAGISFRGTRFAPGETVTIRRGGDTLGTLAADSKGNFTRAFTAPANSGQVQYTFTGSASNMSSSADITVASYVPPK